MLLYLLILWGGGQSKSNALDSKHSNLSDSVSYSNHLESLHKVDSATFNSNSLDSLNSNYSNLSNHLDSKNLDSVSNLSDSNSLDSSFNSKQTQCNSKLNSKLDSKYFNHLESLHKVDSATFNSNSLDSLNSNYSNYSNHLESKNLDFSLDSATHKLDSVSLDSKHSQSLDSVSYSNHLDSKNLDSVSNLSDSNSLDSINLHSIDSATLSLLFMPIDDIQDKLFETNTCEFLPKIYGIYKNVEEIDFTHLPQSFVLKTNHDCGGVVLVQDKDEFLNNKKVFQESMDKLRKHLNTNYYTKTREWHYDNIEPRVFVEEMLGENLSDYRFHCFGGDISFIQIANSSHTTNDIFNTKWQHLPMHYLNPPSQTKISKPNKLSDMLNIAHTLSLPINYVRVDLYVIKNKIFVGELTFTPNGGIDTEIPPIWDKKLGDLWKIKA